MAVFWQGKDWLEVMIERSLRDGRWPIHTRRDTRLLLRMISENQKAYNRSLGKWDWAHVQELREIGNRWAHMEPFSRADACRALDTTARLLRAVGALDEASQVQLQLDALARTPVAMSAADAEPGEDTGRVVEFRRRDPDYLAWIGEHRQGFVLNTGPRGGGEPRLHRATCPTITATQPFTSGDYIKVCSTTAAGLDQWIRDRRGTPAKRCGTCHGDEVTAWT